MRYSNALHWNKLETYDGLRNSRAVFFLERFSGFRASQEGENGCHPERGRRIHLVEGSIAFKFH